MKLVKKPLSYQFILVFIFLFSESVSSMDTITVPDMMFNIDHEKKLIVTNYDVNLINSSWIRPKEFIRMDKVYEFDNAVENMEIGIEYQITNITDNSKYGLYFTQLPIIRIETESKIVDEPRVMAMFTMVESNQKKTVSDIGIEYRGGWSQNYPKKSFRIEFLKDTMTQKTRDICLLDMRTDDDWNLQGMYNEPLRLRSKVCFDLWKMIHILHYKSQEPEAVNGIEMKYAELFLNGLYQGVYCVGERVDRKQLKLKKSDNKIRGELYKGISWGGACTFDSLPDYSNKTDVWGGLEYEYPEEIDWGNIYAFVDLVINETDEQFYSKYQSFFNIDNAVDYFIFLNLLYASDNMGKNIYVAKYDTGQQYFYVPWDLDGSFGIIWDGSRVYDADGFLTNGLYRRLWQDCSKNGFREKLKAKWECLRDSVVTLENLTGMFQNSYDYLNENGVYLREVLVWDSCSPGTQDLQFMFQWIENRLEYLDNRFSEKCVQSKIINRDSKISRSFKSYPNPVSSIVNFNFQSDNLFQVSIFDNKGRLLLSDMLDNKKRQIYVDKLPAGIYYLKVRSGGINRAEKIIIQK